MECMCVKGAQRGVDVSCVREGRKPWTALENVVLECRRGKWSSACGGAVRRYEEEHNWRGGVTGLYLTLRLESVGSEQDRITV